MPSPYPTAPPPVALRRAHLPSSGRRRARGGLPRRCRCSTRKKTGATAHTATGCLIVRGCLHNRWLNATRVVYTPVRCDIDSYSVIVMHCWFDHLISLFSLTQHSLYHRSYNVIIAVAVTVYHNATPPFPAAYTTQHAWPFSPLTCSSTCLLHIAPYLSADQRAPRLLYR